jgi:hypothetical protein
VQAADNCAVDVCVTGQSKHRPSQWDCGVPADLLARRADAQPEFSP